MQKISEGIPEFKVFEKEIYKIMCQIACELISECLEVWDLMTLAERDAGEYRMVNKGTTTVKTVMGEVRYTRRCYRMKAGGHVYLLDEALGLGGGCGLMSENLVEHIVMECSDKSFRKAAESISGLTGQSISPMGAWNALKGFSERLEKQEDRLEELDRAGDTGRLGNIASPALFVELDGVWISRQHVTRRGKDGGEAAAKRWRIGKRPMNIGTAYTGWSQGKGGGHATVDKFAYASYDGAERFGGRFEALLRHRFDMDGVKGLVANGDGDGWIKAFADRVDAVLQLDPYHRHQAIIRAVGDKADRRRLYDAIGERDADRVLATIGEMIAETRDEATLDKLGGLLRYFSSNRESLFTWRERGMELPAPPEGVTYRGLGTQESSNCNILTLRMKRRKGSWTEKGANNMARILCYRHTVGFDVMLGILPEAVGCGHPTEPLSAAKAPFRDGKGDGGGWMRADMPFDQTFRTNGRRAIRGLLGQRPLSDLRGI